MNAFETDRALSARLSGLANVTFVSLLDQLCVSLSRRSVADAKADACLARVPGEDALDLMALDSGHLTPKGSSYLGRIIWKPYLEQVMP
jgi:hypothetical protein